MKKFIFLILTVFFLIVSLNVLGQEAKVLTDKESYFEGEYVKINMYLPDEEFTSCITYFTDPSGYEFRAGTRDCAAGRRANSYDSGFTYVPSAQKSVFDEYVLKQKFGLWSLKVVVNNSEGEWNTLTTTFNYEPFNGVSIACYLHGVTEKTCYLLGSPITITIDGCSGGTYNNFNISILYQGETYELSITATDSEVLPSTGIIVQNSGSSCSENFVNLNIKVKIDDSQVCADSDGGKDYFTKGTTSGYDPIYGPHTSEDNCMKIPMTDLYELQEAYCEPNDSDIWIESYLCPVGCKDGVCLLSKEDETIEDSQICIDSDGNDYYTKGAVSDGSGSDSIDFCITDNRLREFTCPDPNEVVLYDCLYGCENGACLPINKEDRKIFDSYSCVDSDGGKDWYAKGVCSGLDYPNGIADRCDDTPGSEDYADDFYCYRETRGLNNQTVHCVGHTYKCPNGCEDGVCLGEPDCADSDYGRNYDYRGSTSGYDSTGNLQEMDDKCIDLFELEEGYCNLGDKNIHAERYQCPYGCEDGRCMLEKFGELEAPITEEVFETPRTLEKEIICQGCQLNEETCIPFGTRIAEENVGYYCDLSKNVIAQNDNKINCQNNYECSSNICANNECISPSPIQKIIVWFSKFFKI